MAPKGTKRQTAMEKSESSQGLGSSLNTTAHQFVMKELTAALEPNLQLANNIYLIVQQKAFDDKGDDDEAVDKYLTSNNKYNLVPRGVWTDLLNTKSPLAQAHFSQALKSEVVGFRLARRAVHSIEGSVGNRQGCA